MKLSRLLGLLVAVAAVAVALVVVSGASASKSASGLHSTNVYCVDNATMTVSWWDDDADLYRDAADSEAGGYWSFDEYHGYWPWGYWAHKTSTHHPGFGTRNVVFHSVTEGACYVPEPTTSEFCIDGETVTLSGDEVWMEPLTGSAITADWLTGVANDTGTFTRSKGEETVEHTVAIGACGVPGEPSSEPKPPVHNVTHSGPDHYGYCSVQGNTRVDGTPIGAGSFLLLLMDQPLTDEHYKGATPAFWVDGVGITCDLSPAQAAIAAATTAKVDHTGGNNGENGPLFYGFIPKP